MKGLVCLAATLGVACGSPAPGKTYYQRAIEPLLKARCGGNTSGCHVPDAGDPYHFVGGNFDVTSFDTVQKRRDVLAPYGAYPYPLLLIKAVSPKSIDTATPNPLTLQYGTDAMGNAVFLPIEVLHNGGAIIQYGSNDYYTLANWIANGATENGVKPATPAQSGNGNCSSAVPLGFNAAMYTANANFGSFKSNIQPILKNHGCVSGNCHGAPQSDFYITCGDDDNQLAFNFSQAWSFVNNPVDDSQILHTPLAVGVGGGPHTGGDQFASTTDGDYVTIKNWATAVGKLEFAKDPMTGAVDPNKQFFEDHVQPILLQRGCSFQACHSPAATNDFKLRSGTKGFFSAIALQRNYDLLREDFLALEFADVRRSRAIAKAILPDDYRLSTGDPQYVGGITARSPTTGQLGLAGHRGGPALETPNTIPADPAACPVPTLNPAAWNAAMTTPFCNINEWFFLERAALGASVTTPADTVHVVYVDRPSGQTADRLQFDTFQGGADLMAVPATFGASQHLALSGGAASLTGSCGFTGSMDIGMPDVAPDGDKVAFAARPQGGSWNVYTVSITNGNCAPIANLAKPDQNGLHVHDFDPAWTPDGTYIVFASTRGKGTTGPTLSRKRMLPQSDLWRVKPDGSGLEQMTVLSNSELRPHFMREGRVTMTTEKASDGFYQLSGRRINWDLTDYHPLLAQRAISPYADDTTNAMSTKPSIGYNAATDIKEGGDGNFMLILSDLKADGSPVVPGGGGALATFNRSVGPFEQGRTDAGYLASVTVIGNGAATGRAGATEVYRAPFYLPDGQIMVSHAATGSLAWEIVTVNPRTGMQTGTLVTPGGGRATVDAVLAIKNPWAKLSVSGQARTMYDNHRQLVFGGAADPSDPTHAIIHMPDAPMVFTLLTGNLRRGRPVDAFRTAAKLVVYTEGGCMPNTPCTANTNGIFQNRQMLGSASLASDGSVKVKVPAQTGVVLELQDGNGKSVITMGEEHQLGPGEQISMGISEKLFDVVCGGCHGSVSGLETDIGVSADALTGASASASQSGPPTPIGN